MAGRCVKSAALASTPTVLPRTLGDNPEPDSIIISCYWEGCESKKSQRPMVDSEPSRGREGKGKKESRAGCLRARRCYLFSSPAPSGAFRLEGLSCLVTHGHWRWSNTSGLLCDCPVTLPVEGFAPPPPFLWHQQDMFAPPRLGLRLIFVEYPTDRDPKTLLKVHVVAQSFPHSSLPRINRLDADWDLEAVSVLFRYSWR